MKEIVNMMSIDLEDYYCDLPFSDWEKYKSRVVDSTNIILNLFDKYKISATFFTVGYIAEKHPELIEKIISSGHEISSHTFSHPDLRKITKDEFVNDFKNSLSTLSRLSKEKILGFRAPFFSISENNFWVFDILKKYLKYDSSIFPVKTSLYGIPRAPFYTYHVSDVNPLTHDENQDFIEIPPATLSLPVFGRLPIAGGFYLRFLPFPLIKYGIHKLNKQGFSAMCYLHPKDIDPGFPKIPEYKWYYYWDLNHGLKKFEFLLRNFKFSSVRDNLKL